MRQEQTRSLEVIFADLKFGNWRALIGQPFHRNHGLLEKDMHPCDWDPCSSKC